MTDNDERAGRGPGDNESGGEDGDRNGYYNAPPAYWALPSRGHQREVDVLVLETTDVDVLLGRGKFLQQHPGNLHFQGKCRRNR